MVVSLSQCLSRGLAPGIRKDLTLGSKRLSHCLIVSAGVRLLGSRFFFLTPSRRGNGSLNVSEPRSTDSTSQRLNVSMSQGLDSTDSTSQRMSQCLRAIGLRASRLDASTPRPDNRQPLEMHNSQTCLVTRPVATTEWRAGTPPLERATQNLKFQRVGSLKLRGRHMVGDLLYRGKTRQNPTTLSMLPLDPTTETQDATIIGLSGQKIWRLWTSGTNEANGACGVSGVSGARESTKVRFRVIALGLSALSILQFWSETVC